MTIERRALAAVLGLGLFGLTISIAAQSRQTYKARLSAVPADARTRPGLAGSGSATATLNGSKLSITGSFEGLLSPATMAQLHNGVVAGVRGPSIAELTVTKSTSGSISGIVDLTSDQVEHLHKGGLYVELFTEKETDGVIWGWLLK